MYLIEITTFPLPHPPATHVKHFQSTSDKWFGREYILTVQRGPGSGEVACCQAES